MAVAETIVIDIVAEFRNNMSSGMSGATSQVDRFNQSVDRARERMNSLNGQNARPTVSLTDHATSTISKLKSGLRGFAGKTWRAGVKIIDYATRPLRSIKNMLFSIKTLAVAVGAGLVGQQLISKPIQLADSYSSAKIGFSTLLGNKKGQQMMDNLDKFAKETPFKTSNTISQAQKMIAMGWNAKDLVKDMRTIGDAAAATGKGDEGLERIVLALAQIKSKGKLSTEELNQLAEAGISAKRYLAEGLGYGSGDAGIKKLSDDLQKGAIGSEAAIKALMKGMKEYKGMMNKTANETVEGLKSQIEDTFEINVFRKWGQGLQAGAKKGFGSIVKFLDANEDRLAKFGDTLKGIGKTLSTWAAGKVESTIDKLMELSERSDFKNASLFGKVKIAWDEIISKPFGQWWDANGKPYIEGKFKSFGKLMGEGLTNATLAAGKGILSLLGVDTSGMSVFKEASDVGSNFGKGFAEGFDGKKIMKTIKDVFVAGFKSLFSGSGGTLGNIIKTGIKLKLIGGVLSGLSALKGLWYGTGTATGSVLSGGGILSGVGLKGAIGSASAGTGLLGFGANQAIRMGAGNLAGGASMSAGALSAIGLGATAGGALGAAGLLSAGNDFMTARAANNSHDKKRYDYRAGTKLVSVGGGAAAGAAIGSIFGGIGAVPGALIGAGVGGIGALLGGNKLADSISGCKKSYAELNEEIDKLARKDMAKRFGQWSMSAEDLSRSIKHIYGTDTINRINKFNSSLSDLESIQSELADNKYTIDYAGAMIKGGGKLSSSDIKEYKSALKSYASTTKELLTTNKKNSRSAFKVLYGDDTKGMVKMTKGMEKTYSGLEGKLAKKSKKLNKVIAKAFEDGKITINEQKKIDELVGQIEDIQAAVEKRVEKISKAESDAAYDLIKQKYQHEKLTPESFKTLVGELNKQNETTLKGYDDAYIKAKAEIDVELEEGTIDKKKYDKMLKEIEEKWLGGKADTIKKSVEVSLDVVKTNYSDKFSSLKNTISSGGLEDAAQSVINGSKLVRNNMSAGIWTNNSEKSLKDAHKSFMKQAGISKQMQKEMKDMYETLKPQEQDLLDLKQSYEDMGKKVPQWIEDSLSDINNIKLMSGDKDTFYEMLGKQMAEQDTSHAESLLAAKGEDLPKALKKGLEKGLKEVKAESKTVEVGTNLKLKANKKDIDTSNLDKSTKSVVNKLKDKGVIKIDKNGKVKIKTKDGKIDTSGLDKKTKKAVKDLEKKGIIKIDKKGNVTIKAKKVDTKKLDKSAKKAAKQLEKKGLIKINKKGKVSITKKGGINTKNLDKQTKKAVKALAKKGILKIDKKGNVTVKAKKVDTKDAEKKAKDKTKKSLGKKQNVKKNANVKVKSKTKTSDAEKKLKEKVKRSLGKKQNVNKNANVKVKQKTNTSNAKKQSNDKIKKEMSKKLSLNKTADVNVKDNTKTDSAKKSSESKIKNDLKGPVSAKTKTNVTANFGGFNGTLSSLKNSVFSKIKSELSSTTATTTVNIKARRFGGPTAKQKEGHNANGSRIDRETLTWVGENNNREYIIPTTSGKRQRGLSLWMEAGRDLGVLHNADGGVYGSNTGGGSHFREMMNSTANNRTSSVDGSDTLQKASGKDKVEINVGGITIEIASSGNGVASDIEGSKDRISAIIAEALEQAWQNIPLATE